MASELIRFDEATKEFQVSPEAVKVLRSLTGPICVVSVCGRARQGKSFLLNQLLAKLSPVAPRPGTQHAPAAASASARFAVGSTVKPCTKGLWLWSRPVPRTLPNGQTCHLLLLDAEGIDSYDQTADYSNHIFSLALLLSSVLVYNQMGSIDESSVDKLASVCEFARLIWGRADAGGSGRAASASGHSPGAAAGGGRVGGPGAPSSAAAASLSPSPGADDAIRELSPAFVWLLRDFQLQLSEDGRKISERDYMEEVLRELPGDSEAVRAKNQLRVSIKARFPDRECHALVRPLHDEARLAQMDGLHASELRPEFRKGLDALGALLLSRCRPKALRGAPLTGPALAGLAEAYCRIINQGGLPAIASTWQSVVQSECRRALDAATDLYRSRLEASRGREVGLEALEAAHSAALAAALEAFAKQAVGEAAEQEPFLRRLRDGAAAAVAPLRLTKQAEARARALELLTAEGRRFVASTRGQDSDLAAAEARLHDFLREYGKEVALGPDRFTWAAEFLAGTVVPELRRLAQEARSKAAAASQRVSELEAKVSEMTQGSAALRSSLDAASLTESRLGGELAAARGAAEAATAAAAAARAAEAAAGREAAALRDQLAAARVELAARGEVADAGLARVRSELAAAQSRLLSAEAEARAAAGVRAAAEAQLSAQEAELAARATEVEGARRAAEAARAAEAQVRSHAGSLSAQLAAREALVANLQRERDFLQASLTQRQQQQQQQQQEGQQQQAAVAAVAAMTPGGRKRGRAVAELSSAGSGDMDREMVDAGPGGFEGGFGGGDGAGAAGADGGGDEELMEAEAVPANTPVQRTSRRQYTVGGQRRRAGAAAAPAAAAAAATPANAAAPAAAAAAAGGGLGDLGGVSERSPFSVEREVVLTRTRGRPAAATTMTPGVGTPPPPARTPPAATTAAAGGDLGGVSEQSPFSVEREVVLTRTRGSLSTRGPDRGVEADTTATAAAAAPTPRETRAGGAAAAAIATAAAAAAAAGPRPPLPAKLDSMKVNELKHWLTLRGWGGEVADHSRRGTTQREWVELVRSKCAAAPAAAASGGGVQPAAGGRGQARR